MPTQHQGETTDSAARTVRNRYNRVARVYDLEQLFEEPVVFGRLRKALWADAPTEASSKLASAPASTCVTTRRARG